jgi:hypothetical protein
MEWLIRRILIALAVVSAGAVSVGVGLVHFAHGLASADLCPAFMTDYEKRAARTYEEAERAFSDFVVETFPTGSDAKAAIAKIAGGGFQVARSASGSVELFWQRHAGPCSEQYSIIVSQDGDGRIANIVGKLRPICL